jgi:chromosome condensin MukBEF complex kleisin-like MukF subunit
MTGRHCSEWYLGEQLLKASVEHVGRVASWPAAAQSVHRSRLFEWAAEKSYSLTMNTTVFLNELAIALFNGERCDNWTARMSKRAVKTLHFEIFPSEFASKITTNNTNNNNNRNSIF